MARVYSVFVVGHDAIRRDGRDEKSLGVAGADGVMERERDGGSLPNTSGLLRYGPPGCIFLTSNDNLETLRTRDKIRFGNFIPCLYVPSGWLLGVILFVVSWSGCEGRYILFSNLFTPCTLCIYFVLASVLSSAHSSSLSKHVRVYIFKAC